MPHSTPPRLSAAAELALARRAVDDAVTRMADAGEPLDPHAYVDALFGIDQLADEIMEPYHVANVLETLEETRIAEGDVPWSITGYEGALKALVDVRDAAREDEVVG